MLSGIQHFVFCRRQWALIHIEQQWEENVRTVDGAIMHGHAHDAGFHEKRGDWILARGMAVSSSELGLSGTCDVVEFCQGSDGIPLPGRQGLYRVFPVEYKRGTPKADESDRLQLAAQAMCLEEMLCCTISEGFLYYGETRHRLKVEIDDELRTLTRKTAEEMHNYYQRGYTPKAKRKKACNACSLKHRCLPGLEKKKASEYIQNLLSEGECDEKAT